MLFPQHKSCTWKTDLALEVKFHLDVHWVYMAMATNAGQLKWRQMRISARAPVVLPGTTDRHAGCWVLWGRWGLAGVTWGSAKGIDGERATHRSQLRRCWTRCPGRRSWWTTVRTRTCAHCRRCRRRVAAAAACVWSAPGSAGWTRSAWTRPGCPRTARTARPLRCRCSWSSCWCWWSRSASTRSTRTRSTCDRAQRRSAAGWGSKYHITQYEEPGFS